MHKNDLKDGTGDPWAGQKRLRGRTDLLSRVELFWSSENFGVEPPTGSAKRGYDNKPKRGQGRPLSWARKAEGKIQRLYESFDC